MSKERYINLSDRQVKDTQNQSQYFLSVKTICRLLNKQDQQIADLEAKLAEKDKAIENWQTMYQSVMRSCHNSIEEDKRLREQLAEKEKEIEKWKSMAERSSSVLDRFNYCGESIIYNTTREQDKISFAVEQLNATYRLLNDKSICITGTGVNAVRLYTINEVFKSQIEQLTHQHEDK